MAMRSLKCASCGGTLEVDSEMKVGFCPYCGNKFMLRETVDVNLKVDNGNSNKVKMAYQYIEERNYEKAEKLFKNVLNDDIANHEAWWGRYLCETYYAKYYGYVDRYGSTSKQIKARIIEKNLQFAYKAIENASEEEANRYREWIEDDEKFVRENL